MGVIRMIRVVIVSMYEKLSKDGLEYGATRILNLWRCERVLTEPVASAKGLRGCSETHSL